jgi:hypothetical protein
MTPSLESPIDMRSNPLSIRLHRREQPKNVSIAPKVKMVTETEIVRLYFTKSDRYYMINSTID